MAGQEVRLEGFQGFNTYLISRSLVADDGSFGLPYSEKDRGMGIVNSSADESFVIVLSGEDIVLKGESFAQTEKIDITQGQENKYFEQYAFEHPRGEQTLSAWIFLENIYRSDSLFTVHEEPRQAII